MPRYHFDEFVLWPRRRLLLRNGREQPLIPRYFDLLVFLVERRHEAVHRRDIFDHVWRDVVVSDSALSQAIRTIRRVLGDDTREPRFIRTVSRHGYRFVFTDVREEDDDTGPPGSFVEPAPAPTVEHGFESRVPGPESRVPSEGSPRDGFESLLERVTRRPTSVTDEEDQREAAELLHTMGTGEALRRLGTRPRHAFARALLRDTRWDVANAGAVPLLGEPGAAAASAALVVLRLRRAARIAAARWASGSLGGALAGAAAGFVGGALLAALPGSPASPAVVPVLTAAGGSCGAIGGAGVAAGLAAVEAVVRSRRIWTLIAGGALGGAAVGLAVQWMARWTLMTVVGVPLPIGGGLEGLLIGAAAGLGYGLSTAGAEGGFAAPRGPERWKTVAATAFACGLAAFGLTTAGRPLVGGTIHRIAELSPAAQTTLTPLARLLGEPDFGPVTGTLIGTGEGLLFGIGLALGLTKRP